MSVELFFLVIVVECGCKDMHGTQILSGLRNLSFQEQEQATQYKVEGKNTCKHNETKQTCDLKGFGVAYVQHSNYCLDAHVQD